jgi:hypothetical protein
VERLRTHNIVCSTRGGRIRFSLAPYNDESDVNQKGYEGTALSDLMQATGLEKAGSTVTSIASKSLVRLREGGPVK